MCTQKMFLMYTPSDSCVCAFEAVVIFANYVLGSKVVFESVLLGVNGRCT